MIEMIKRNKGKMIASSIVILLPMVAGLMLWNVLPAQMPAHWSLNGTVNGWCSKYVTVFALPLVLLAGHWIGIALTGLDPRNRNQTRKAMGLIYWICPFVSVFASAMIYAQTFEVDLGWGVLWTVALGLMFVVIGNLLPKCKRNYTMGIKVKWALENDENWNATHRFGGKVWVAGGVLIMLCSFLPRTMSHYVSFALLMILAFVPVVYSYAYHRKQMKNGTAAASTPLSKGYRRIRAIVVCVILVGVGILLYSGDISMRYDDASFTIEASYWGDLTVDYASIERIEYREGGDAGARTSGFGSLRLQMGTYRNDEFDYYTRYTYTLNKPCVVLAANGRTLVVNGKTEEATRAIYDALSERMEQ